MEKIYIQETRVRTECVHSAFRLGVGNFVGLVDTFSTRGCDALCASNFSGMDGLRIIERLALLCVFSSVSTCDAISLNYAQKVIECVYVCLCFPVLNNVSNQKLM